MFKLLPGETRIYNAGIHWFIIFTRAASQIFLAALPAILYAWLGRYFDATVGPNLHNALSLLWVIWLGILWIGFFYTWTDYYLDRWVITDKRIIDIEQKGMFSREVASVHFDHIQDIVVEVEGFWSTILDVGDVHIQTAGTEKEVIFENMAHPHQVRDLIISLMTERMEQPRS